MVFHIRYQPDEQAVDQPAPFLSPSYRSDSFRTKSGSTGETRATTGAREVKRTSGIVASVTESERSTERERRGPTKNPQGTIAGKQGNQSKATSTRPKLRLVGTLTACVQSEEEEEEAFNNPTLRKTAQ